MIPREFIYAGAILLWLGLTFLTSAWTERVYPTEPEWNAVVWVFLEVVWILVVGLLAGGAIKLWAE